MKSTQVTLEHILAHVLICSKKEERDGIITLIRPDFSVEHRIPGLKPNWSPDKVEINKDLNTMKVWRIGDRGPSISVEHILPDEQGYSDVEGLSHDDLPRVEIPKTQKAQKVEKKPKPEEKKVTATFDTFDD